MEVIWQTRRPLHHLEQLLIGQNPFRTVPLDIPLTLNHLYLRGVSTYDLYNINARKYIIQFLKITKKWFILNYELKL
jgi:hypothetical protein